MELAKAYALLESDRREDFHRYQEVSGISGTWDHMHNTSPHRISIIAGRQTGKSTNIARKAYESEYDTIIYVPNRMYISMMETRIVELDETKDAREILTRVESRDVLTINMRGGRKIEIETAAHAPGGKRGTSWKNKLILFEEFDNRYFISLINQLQFEVAKAKQVVCVGSMRSTEPNHTKSWFKQSDLRYFIDSGYEPPTRGHMPEDYTPSILADMINNDLPEPQSILY